MIMILKGFIILVVSYFAVSAFAEYRAFELRIEKIENPEEFRTFVSSLDPQQYRGYFPVKPDERIYYTSSWMCRGRTGGFRKACENPKLREPAADEASGAQQDPTSVEKTLTP